MRRVGGLFEELCSFDNLLLAAKHAARGKRYRPDVLRFNLRLEDRLHALAEELSVGSWRPQPHRHFVILEPKTRWVSAAPFSDRVVHHALCNVTAPAIDRRLIFDCWANRKGKGSHRAVLRYQQLALSHRYALKVDIRQYFPAIDHQLLKALFRRVFKETRLLALMDGIVDRGLVPEPFEAYFTGDDLFTRFKRPKGLPIGNLTSQHWANLYLDRFDHWVKEELCARAYLRFVDDFVLLSNSKSQLKEWLGAVTEALALLRLLPHPSKCVIRRTDEGLPFLGYMVWPGRIRVLGATVRRFRGRLRRRQTEGGLDDARTRSLAAWKGHVGLGGSWRRLGRLA